MFFILSHLLYPFVLLDILFVTPSKPLTLIMSA